MYNRIVWGAEQGARAPTIAPIMRHIDAKEISVAINIHIFFRIDDRRNDN